MNWTIVFAAVAIVIGNAASVQTRGLSDNEITLGLITDLSGSVANSGSG